MTDRAAWVCPLCGAANAPHVDRCACTAPAQMLAQPLAQTGADGGAAAQNGHAADVSEALGSKGLRTKPRQRKTYDYTYPGFEEFWGNYPLKLDKYKAAPAFAAAVEAGADVGAIIAGAAAYAAYIRRNGIEAQHVKYAQGWLNGHRWEDDYDSAPRRSKVGNILDLADRADG